jgi:hypothetical protein
MLKIYFVILFLFTLASLRAQELLPRTESKFITSFPFKQFSGGVIVLKAKFGDISDTLNFILDTGSGGISLDSGTCEEFHIQTRKTDTTLTGIGGAHRVAFAFDKTLRLPGLTVEHLNFHVNNYDILSSVYGEKIDGIIGYSFFSRFVVKVNFDSSQIEVYTPGKVNYPKGGHMLHPAFTSLPIQWLNIKDKNKSGFNFYLDTGAGICLLLSEKFAKDSGILLKKRKPVLTQAEGMAGKLQMQLTVIREVKIGPYKFRKVPTYIYRDEYNVTSYPFTGGLFGNDLLRRFNLIFNYPDHEIHLLPNSHYFDVFDYAYTGLGIYYNDGKIIIEDVIPDSPADKGHFKNGDEIMAVDNNFSRNIQVYKNMLQKPFETVKVIVKREGLLKVLTIKISSIR